MQMPFGMLENKQIDWERKFIKFQISLTNPTWKTYHIFRFDKLLHWIAMAIVLRIFNEHLIIWFHVLIVIELIWELHSLQVYCWTL